MILFSGVIIVYWNSTAKNTEKQPCKRNFSESATLPCHVKQSDHFQRSRKIRTYTLQKAVKHRKHSFVAFLRSKSFESLRLMRPAVPRATHRKNIRPRSELKKNVRESVRAFRDAPSRCPCGTIRMQHHPDKRSTSGMEVFIRWCFGPTLAARDIKNNTTVRV